MYVHLCVYVCASVHLCVCVCICVCACVCLSVARACTLALAHAKQASYQLRYTPKHSYFNIRKGLLHMPTLKNGVVFGDWIIWNLWDCCPVNVIFRSIDVGNAKLCSSLYPKLDVPNREYF